MDAFLNHFRLMKRIMLIVTLLLIVSCDGYQSICGLVIDSETKTPIEKAIIKTINPKFKAYSDKNGYFEFHNVTGFIFSDNDLTVVISKVNYINDTLNIKNGDSKLVKLIKTE